MLLVLRMLWRSRAICCCNSGVVAGFVLMRIMALDIGDVRTGIAISDPSEMLASPVCVLPSVEVLAHAKPFQRVIEDWEPEVILCGLPLTLSGEIGPQAEHIQEMAQTISATIGIPVEFTDERMSSTDAKRKLREMGYDEKTMRGKVDMIAASIFLQSWLDGRSSQTER